MKPYEYCEQRAGVAGFDHLYRFIFRSDTERLAVLAIRSLEQQFDELIEDTSEATVAMTQLQWWTEEFERFYADEPRHPITLALQQTNLQQHLQRSIVNEWLTTTASEIESPVADDESSWHERQNARAGAADRLIGLVLENEPDRFSEWQPGFTSGRRLARNTLLLGRHLRNGYVSLPLQMFESQGVDPSSALDVDSRPAVATMAANFASQAIQALDSSLANAPSHTNEHSAPLLATACVLRTRIEALDTNAAEVLDGEVRITALRQVLAARRGKRQAKKNAR